MREARLAGLDLVARADLHRNLDADQIRKSGRHDDDSQAVSERRFGGGERQNITDSGAHTHRWHRQTSSQHGEAERETRLLEMHMSSHDYSNPSIKTMSVSDSATAA